MPDRTPIVRHNLLDASFYSELRRESALLKEMDASITRLAPQCDPLLSDLYYLLYKKILYLETPKQPTLHTLIISELSQQLSVNKLRNRTAGNRSETHVALWVIAQELLERLRGARWLNDVSELLTQLADREQSNNFNVSSNTFADTPTADQDFWKGLLTPKSSAVLEKIAQTLSGSSGLAEQAETLDEIADSLERASNDGTASALPLKAGISAAEEADAEGGSQEEAFLSAMAEELSSDYSPDSDTSAPAASEENDSNDPLKEGMAPDSAQPNPTAQTLAASFKKAAAEGRLRMMKYQNGTFRGNQESFTIPDSSGPDQRRILRSGPPENRKTPVAETLEPGAAPGIEISKRHLSSKPGIPAAAASPATGTANYDYLLKKIHEKLQHLHGDAIISQAVGKLDNMESLFTNAGTSPRDMDTLPFDEVIGLYKRTLNPVMIQFFNKVGQKKELAKAAQHRKKAKKDLPVDKIQPDDDLDNLIDDEFTDLALDIEAFENSFIDRFLHKNLLTRARVSKTARHKGPIVLCYDGSGSMEGDKIIETKAHILAFLEVARIQRRRMVTIQFASASEPLYVKEFHPRGIRFSEILELIDTFLRGGTDFERPLREALTYLESDRFRNGDILFITDGICDISESFKRRFLASKAEKKFKLYAVIIHGNTYEDYGDLESISDEILEIRQRDLSNWNQKVSEKLFSI